MLPEIAHHLGDIGIFGLVMSLLSDHHHHVGDFLCAQTNDGVLYGGNLAQPPVERRIGDPQDFAGERLVAHDELFNQLRVRVFFGGFTLNFQGCGIEGRQLNSS